jgi:hypothetical protein
MKNTEYDSSIGQYYFWQDLRDSTATTLFSISLPNQPKLTIAPAGANAVLSWTTNATGFTLQSATDLASPDWTVLSSAPTVLSGQNTVTNPISGAQEFYRLSQ